MNQAWKYDPLNQPVSSEVLGIAREVFDDNRPLFGDELVAAAERIFGAKAVDATEEQKRQFELAKKYNALVWVAMPTKDGKVGIKVLVTAKKPLDK